jgi:hypothetical protein
MRVLINRIIGDENEVFKENNELEDLYFEFRVKINF